MEMAGCRFLLLGLQRSQIGGLQRSQITKLNDIFCREEKITVGNGQMGRRPLSTTFRSVKPNSISPKQSTSTSSAPAPSSPSSSSQNSWCAYLILSTNPPIKTYVGVTTNLSRRIKQHNGKLRGGAKASRAGRPWVYACIIQGFKDQSEACEFESRWKSISRKLPRKHETGQSQKLVLLQHREAALSRLKSAIGCTHLKIDWKLNPSS